MNWRVLAVGALVVVPLLIVLALGFGHDPHELPSVLQNKPAPDFTLRDLDGAEEQLASFAGKPVVINFWSTWCEPCKLEHDNLQRAATLYGDRVQFLGIVYQDDADLARRYLARRSNGYPQLIDPKSHVALDYGVSGVPETYFISARGEVEYKAKGAVTLSLLMNRLDAMFTEERGR